MSEEEIKKLKRQRGSVKAKLTIFSNFLRDLENKEIEENDFFEIETRLGQSEKIIQDFEDIQAALETVVNDSELETEFKTRSEFSTFYYSEVSKAKILLKKCSAVATSSSGSIHSGCPTTQQANVKLPPIEIPRFRGDYENWLEFRETFESLIHANSSLSDVQRYHYLKSSLSGNAAEVVASLEFSADNYPIAWSLLCDRFNNSRLLIQNHVKAVFNLEVCCKQSSKLLRTTIDSLSKHLKALKQLKQPTEFWDTLIIYIVTSKLDKTTVHDWEEFVATEDSPALDDLKSFLKSKADLLETLELKANDLRSHKQHNNQTKTYLTANEPGDHKNKLNNANFTHPNINCAFCKRDTHYIRNCPDFLKLSAYDRMENAKRLKLCINCLRYGHKNINCRLSNCKKCNSRHNTLLHPSRPEPNTSGQSTTLTTYDANSGAVLLSTALIQVVDVHNNAHTVRAILDSASQSCFITNELCKRLGLEMRDACMTVAGINNATSKIKYKCNLNIQSQHTPYKANITCFVIDNISGTLPNLPINSDNLKIPSNLTLADASFAKPGPIEILIGASLFWELISIGQIKLGTGLPILQKTVFGWIISGPLGYDLDKNIQCHFNKEIDVQHQLSKFWELEEYSSEPYLSPEDKLCEQHFVQNSMRDENGRFVVSIPFKYSLDKLGESKTQAKKRFLSLERKLSRDTNLKMEYTKFMREYEVLGHMRKIEECDDTEKITYYMPHHGVLKETSSTTRLRVVFDASAQTTSGDSLNDLQMVGPTIQNDLISILLRFRSYEYVVVADIAKMYRQVLVNPTQRSLQRIIWRNETSEPLGTYELQTVTYGTSSAAFLAIRCLFQLALDCCESHPDISDIIKNDFYVDDALFGGNSIAETSRFASELSNILHSGGFELRKWHSNCKQILKNISSHVSNSDQTIEIGSNETTKTLGLAWSSSDDKLTYNIGITSKDSRVTKRVILSCVSRIFDPLGLVSPCVISVKILLQKLWLERLAWDETVPAHIHTAWFKFKKELDILNEVKITRQSICKRPKSIEMHCFSDASESAYGSCIYLRSTDEDENVYVHLMCSKTKVAPLKVISVPRLELCGAVLSARLAKKVKQTLKFQLDRITFWTDSTIVLGWLKVPPSALKTFVANRVSEIQELTGSSTWRHISTKDNPADILSRGMSPSELKNSEVWWFGPSWLSQSEDQWPESKFILENLPEVKSKTLNLQTREPIIQFERFSSLNRIKRATAYVFRFVYNLKNTQGKRTGVLTASEIENAFLFLLKESQNELFSEEISLLSSGKCITPRSKLFSLNPFLDDRGILRVGGRLKNSDFHYNKKHPIIISAKHQLCKIFFRSEHLRLLHAGPQLLLSNIKDFLWPVGGRNLAKLIVRQCVTCFKFNPKNISPMMGDLPQKRLESAFPFQICGVDYAGPFSIKDRKGRGCKIVKCYLALFVCFSIKAVHLEIVSDLSTDTFMLALKRFISRRGKPTRIYSDNGTNFVGANAELQELAKFFEKQHNKILESCANEGIEWRFIPVNSPHFGGLWEAGIKSSKFHLKRVVGSNILTFEEMYTVFARIEAVLNSRPISPLSTDPNDLSPLTPAHLLIGRSLQSMAEPNVTQIPINRLSRYQLIEQIQQQFWTRWSKEYVSEIQQRTKWRKNQGEAHKGALVLIKEDNLPPMRWKMGRIIDLHPGHDGISRVASIQTSNGVIKRACQKICPLPIEDVESESFQGGGHVGDD